MKIYPQLKSVFSTNYYSKQIDSVKKSFDKFFEPVNVLSKENCELFHKVLSSAEKKYDRLAATPVKLSVKNGNKEFSYTYSGSVWHRFSLHKKGQELCNIELMHVKNDKVYEFYSTGAYACKIKDEKFIKKYNDLFSEWLPKMVKSIEKQEKKEALALK